jgi:hypothetical protein
MMVAESARTSSVSGFGPQLVCTEQDLAGAVTATALAMADEGHGDLLGLSRLPVAGAKLERNLRHAARNAGGWYGTSFQEDAKKCLSDLDSAR